MEVKKIQKLRNTSTHWKGSSDLMLMESGTVYVTNLWRSINVGFKGSF